MKILYLCTGNSARSQMAEAFTRAMAPSAAGIEVFSAGTDPRGLHPQTVAVMSEAGLDVASARSKGIDAVPYESIDIVVTLCDEARATCPTTPPGARRIHWGLSDPALAQGSPDEIREQFRAVRDEVRTCVKRLLFELATTRGGRRQA